MARRIQLAPLLSVGGLASSAVAPAPAGRRRWHVLRIVARECSATPNRQHHRVCSAIGVAALQRLCCAPLQRAQAHKAVKDLRDQVRADIGALDRVPARRSAGSSGAVAQWRSGAATTTPVPPPGRWLEQTHRRHVDQPAPRSKRRSPTRLALSVCVWRPRQCVPRPRHVPADVRAPADPKH